MNPDCTPKLVTLAYFAAKNPKNTRKWTWAGIFKPTEQTNLNWNMVHRLRTFEYAKRLVFFPYCLELRRLHIDVVLCHKIALAPLELTQIYLNLTLLQLVFINVDCQRSFVPPTPVGRLPANVLPNGWNNLPSSVDFKSLSSRLNSCGWLQPSFNFLMF